MAAALSRALCAGLGFARAPFFLVSALFLDSPYVEHVAFLFSTSEFCSPVRPARRPPSLVFLFFGFPLSNRASNTFYAFTA